MRTHFWRPLVLALGVGIGACGSDNPVTPQNHRPSVLSLTVFPAAIGLSDSAIVVCNAMDPDADTLVYDWITDDRVRLQGARPGDPFLYSSYLNSVVVYPQAVTPPDTVWVEGHARDRRGGMDSRIVRITVH